MALFFGLRLMAEIHLQGAPQTQAAHAFVEHFGIHQHTAHVGMNKDRIGLFFRLGRTAKRATLTTIERVCDSVLIGDLSLSETLHAYA